jgi:TRAP-type mannitol/chloroaromatic compound transport system permease large subunit
MLLLMAALMPIAIAMALPGFIGTTYLMGITPALTALGTIPFSYSHSFTFTTIPMFILMGHLVFIAGISRDIFRSSQKWLGQLRGGLAVDFDAEGLWSYDGSSWSQLTPWDCENLADEDLN